jgi:chromosome segregation ATPase
MPGDAGELVGELRRRAEAAEARADILAGEVVQQRERAAKAEGQAMTLRHGLENALGRAERAEARAEAEARTAIETRRQVTEAMMQVASLQTERDTALASRDAAQAAADAARAAEAELAGMTATTRQVPGMTLRDVAIGVGGGAVVAFLTWAVLR